MNKRKYLHIRLHIDLRYIHDSESVQYDIHATCSPLSLLCIHSKRFVGVSEGKNWKSAKYTTSTKKRFLCTLAFNRRLIKKELFRNFVNFESERLKRFQMNYRKEKEKKISKSNAHNSERGNMFEEWWVGEREFYLVGSFDSISIWHFFCVLLFRIQLVKGE